MEEHEAYMRRALELAREAAEQGEVPVGCVIVQNGRIIGEGRNCREEKKATASHAEMEAIAQANAAAGSWRLADASLYVTLSPAPCAPARSSTPASAGCISVPGTASWAPWAA